MDSPLLPNRIRVAGAVLLALPLLASGINQLFGWIDPDLSGATRGEAFLLTMRESGLMQLVAVGHLILGALLLWPTTRFAAALLQLPITLGIVAFNVTMLPSGIPLAFIMLALNVVALADRTRLRRLVQSPQARLGAQAR